MKKLNRLILQIVAVLFLVFIAVMLMNPTPEMESEEPTVVTTAPTEVTEPEEPPLPPANIYYPTDFAYNDRNLMTCVNYPYITGIDVSEYQEGIDYNILREHGIQFVMIRAGFRGYGESGRLVEDASVYRHIKEAHEVGMKVGIYFFSQATSVEEAVEEAELTLSIVNGLPIELPIAYDWEYIGDYARTADTDKETVTACTKAFCDTIAAAGYRTMFYSNQNMSDSHFDLVELQDYPMWLAMYDTPMTYPHRLYMWQYTASAEIPGIDGPLDLNIYLPFEQADAEK